MHPQTGAVIPPNLLRDRFVHFTADNIDMNDATLDGKKTFHATQAAAWQRGPAPDLLLSNLKPSNKTKLDVPTAMNELIPVSIIEGHADVTFQEAVQKDWYTVTEDKSDAAIRARATDMAFVIERQDKATKPGWSVFNQANSSDIHEVTTIGYMPIIQAPAHELDTLNTVVQRFIHVSSSLGQKHVVQTVDQALC